MSKAGDIFESIDPEDLDTLNQRVRQARYTDKTKSTISQIEKLHGYLSDGEFVANQIIKQLEVDPEDERNDELVDLLDYVSDTLKSLEAKFDRERKKLGIEYEGWKD